MMLQRSLMLVLFAAGGLAGCQRVSATLTPRHAAALRDSVRAEVEHYRGFAARGAWDSLAALYSRAPDVRWIEDGKRTDGAAIRRELSSLGPLHVETAYDSLDVAALAPGIAFVTTYHHTRFIGTRVAFAGAISMIWTHEPDGWRIHGGHSSVPVAHPQQ